MGFENGKFVEMSKRDRYRNRGRGRDRSDFLIRCWSIDSAIPSPIANAIPIPTPTGQMLDKVTWRKYES